MADDAPKTVRLRNSETGIVVETTEENASRLRGYESEKASSSTSSKSSK